MKSVDLSKETVKPSPATYGDLQILDQDQILSILVRIFSVLKLEIQTVSFQIQYYFCKFDQKLFV